jgi:simple sugar transport system ATP-binding protein
MARALANDPRVIVAENPTRGLDVRAAGDGWGALHQAAAERAAVLVWSSDIDEIMAHSTRLLVVARGELYDVPAETDRASIGSMMLGGAAGTADL